MLADDPGQDKNIYSGFDHSVMMRKMASLPHVSLRKEKNHPISSPSICLLASFLTHGRRPDFESAEEDESAAPLPHSRDEDEQNKGVMTKIKRNRWTDGRSRLQREDGWMKSFI